MELANMNQSLPSKPPKIQTTSVPISEAIQQLNQQNQFEKGNGTNSEDNGGSNNIPISSVKIDGDQMEKQNYNESISPNTEVLNQLIAPTVTKQSTPMMEFLVKQKQMKSSNSLNSGSSNKIENARASSPDSPPPISYKSKPSSSNKNLTESDSSCPYSSVSNQVRVNQRMKKFPLTSDSEDEEKCKAEPVEECTSIAVAVKTVGGGGEVHSLVNPLICEGEPENPIYHKIRLSESWLYGFLLCHIGQFGFLLGVGYPALPTATFIILVIIILTVVILTLTARYLVTKSRLSESRNIKLRNGVCSPEDEMDDVPDATVYLVSCVAILEGVAFAIFAATTAGYSSQYLSSGGFYSQSTLVQILRFSSITLLTLHRILRPANRVDPMRTILELEVVSVCWDALDGSTLFELLDQGPGSLTLSLDIALRVLMAFWYASVGVRMSIMFLTHLEPTSRIYQMVLPVPLKLAPQPTVDRTLEALRIRSMVIMVMASAEFYALIVRSILWSRGQLDSLQQDMTLKNALFLSQFYTAYGMYYSSKYRSWNSPEIFLCLRYPNRFVQLELFRWSFIIFYILESCLLSLILLEVISEDSFSWLANIGVDVLLSVIFYFYCQNVHIHQTIHEPGSVFYPRKGFFAFPGWIALTMSCLIATSLFAVRIPSIYFAYSDMAQGQVLWTYQNALLIVILSVVPVGLFAMFWSISFMLFRKEFTAAPGNYNAIHDPTIAQVSVATMTEGALDILSCATLMELAGNNLPSNVNNAVVLFSLLEIFNACQSFALQSLLSGGHDDTPVDLVKWKAYLRGARSVIDLGTFILRVVLWIEYNAVSSVFLIKNLYNLIHTGALIERWYGVHRYPKDVLFSEYVPPPDWYGLTKEQWRAATSDTLVLQARAGRRI